MSALTAVYTRKAPEPFGPFVQAVKTDTLVFSTGQLPLDPATGELVSEDVRIQTFVVRKKGRVLSGFAEYAVQQFRRELAGAIEEGPKLRKRD